MAYGECFLGCSTEETNGYLIIVVKFAFAPNLDCPCLTADMIKEELSQERSQVENALTSEVLEVLLHFDHDKDWYMTGIFLNVPKVTLDVIEKNEHDIFDQITKFVVEITRNIPDYTKKLPQRESDPLSLSDVNNAFILVHDNNIEDWYNIALLLGVKQNAIDMIKTNPRLKYKSMHRKTVEVLHSWLSDSRSTRTKKVLQNAIQDATNEKEVMKSLFTSILKEKFLHDNKKMVDLFLDNLENRGVNDWYLLGICIGLRKDQLDAIKHNESSRCLLDVVHLWLMKNPSFDELIKQCDCVNNPNKMTLVKCDHMCMHPERYLRELEKHGSVYSLKNALGAVIEIAESWYSFGIQLGLNKTFLDGIKQEKSVRSMIDVLDNWLNPTASWKTLVKAKVRLVSVHRIPESIYEQEFNLMNAVYAVKDIEDWETVGIYLGLSKDQLNNVPLRVADRIKDNNERMKIEVMDYWFELGDNKRTLDEFIAALSRFESAADLIKMLKTSGSENPFTTTTAECLPTEVRALSFQNVLSYVSARSWYKLGKSLNIPKEMLNKLAEETYSDVQRKERIILKWLKSSGASWKSLYDAVNSIDQSDWSPIEVEIGILTKIRNLKKVYQGMIDDFEHFSLQEIEILKSIQRKHNQLILLEKKLHESSKQDIVLELNEHEKRQDSLANSLQKLRWDAYAKLKGKNTFKSIVGAGMLIALFICGLYYSRGLL